jgi:hypothetical protein
VGDGEAALWAVDPPDYFTEGVFVALDASAYTSGLWLEWERGLV